MDFDPQSSFPPSCNLAIRMIDMSLLAIQISDIVGPLTMQEKI